LLQDPDNAKPAVLISAQRIHHFEGMSRPDSLDLLEEVLTHGTSDDIIYKHEWQPNDFAVWANRRLIHTASPAKGFSHSKDKMRMYHLVFLDTNQFCQLQTAERIDACPDHEIRVMLMSTG